MQRIYIMNVMPLLDVSMREEALDFIEEERRLHLSALKPELSKAQSVGAGLLLAYAVSLAEESETARGSEAAGGERADLAGGNVSGRSEGEIAVAGDHAADGTAVGDYVADDLVARDLAVGGSVAGDSAVGNFAADDLVARDLAVGDSVAGDSASSDLVADGAVVGDYAADGAVVGDYAADGTVVGDYAADDLVARDLAAGDSVAGDTASSDLVADDYATDDHAADGTVVGDYAADDLVARDLAVGGSVASDLATDNLAEGERGTVTGEDFFYEEVRVSDILSVLKSSGHHFRNTFKIKSASTGKPFFSNCSSLHFNLSHSGEYAACVLADHEVGVDIQKEQGAAAVRRIARRILHTEEMRYREEESMLYRIWTVKEAYVKTTGEGIRRDFRKIRVDFEKGTVEGMPFTLWEPVPGYMLAVCSFIIPL